MFSRKIVKVSISIILLSLATIYLVKAFENILFSELIASIYFPTESFLIITLICSVAGFTSAWVWYLVNLEFQPQNSISKSYWVWSISRLFRYIPGKATSYWVRHKLQKTSVSKSVIAAISELQITLIPIFIIALIFFIFVQYDLKMTLLSGFAMCCTIFLQSIAKLPLKYTPFISIEPSSIYGPTNALKKSLLTSPSLLLNGLAFYLTIDILNNTNDISYVVAMAVLYISGLIGNLALLVPSGLVVREASIVYFLFALGLPKDVALYVAAFSRATLFCGELVNALISSLLIKIYYAKEN